MQLCSSDAVKHNAGCPFLLSEIEIAPQARFLILAPHPDDFDEVAVTLKYFFTAGHEMSLIVLTGASSGVLDSFVSPPTRENKERVREEEQKSALEFFGLPSGKAQFLALPEDGNGEILIDSCALRRVKEAFCFLMPDVVSLPYGNDTNVTHRRVFDLFQEIVSERDKKVLGLYHKDPKTIDIRIDAYFPFDEASAKWKSEMLRFHQSQHTRNMETRGYGLDERILRVNRDIANDLNLDSPYAEGFQLEVFPAPGEIRTKS